MVPDHTRTPPGKLLKGPFFTTLPYIYIYTPKYSLCLPDIKQCFLGWEPPAQDKSRSTRNSDEKADLEHLHNVMKTILTACRYPSLSKFQTYRSHNVALEPQFVLNKLQLSGTTPVHGHFLIRWTERLYLTTMSM